MNRTLSVFRLEWLRDGDSIKVGDENIAQDRLSINQIDESIEGKYQCRVNRTNGSIEATASAGHLNIYGMIPVLLVIVVLLD